MQKMEGREKNTLIKPSANAGPYKSHLIGNANFVNTLDPPVLESQIHSKFDQKNNEDLPPPTLKLIEELIIHEHEGLGKAVAEESLSEPKDLIVRLSRQKLSPRQLVIQLKKLKETKEVCNTDAFLISGEHKNPYTCTLRTKYETDYQKRLPPSIECYACPESFDTVILLKKHLFQCHFQQ